MKPSVCLQETNYEFLKCEIISDDVQRDIFLADLVVRLHEQFSYDNGILMVYFLNYMQLKPGEAIYLAANDPHAYISGGKYPTYLSLVKIYLIYSYKTKWVLSLIF